MYMSVYIHVCVYIHSIIKKATSVNCYRFETPLLTSKRKVHMKNTNNIKAQINALLFEGITFLYF